MNNTNAILSIVNEAKESLLKGKTPKSVKDISLELVKEPHSQHYIFKSGTKYLKPCVFDKHHSFNISLYDENREGNRNKSSKHLTAEKDGVTKYINLFDERINTRRAVKEWILNFDREFEAYVAEKLAETRKKEEAYQAKKDIRNSVTDTFTKPIKNSPKSKLGQKVQARMSYMKSNSIGEALEDSRVEMVKIENTMNMSNSDYDKFVSTGTHSSDFSTQGGSESDDPRLSDYDFDDVLKNPDLMKIFRETAYIKVTEVLSKNRKTIYVNSEGYTYPRYLGAED